MTKEDPMRIHRTLALGAATLALVLSACAPGEGSSPTPAETGSQPAATDAGTGELPAITVGSAGFYEAALVGEIYAQALENAGFTVERQLEIGERPNVQSALTAGEVDLVPEYLGGLGSYLEAEVSSDADATYDNLVEALGEMELVALEYSPGTDADGFVVRQETAEELELATMSDLAEVADQLVWGLAPACPENPVCGPGLEEVYGIDIAELETETLTPCSTEMAEALNNSAIDVAQVCTTQPDIARFNFVLLEDDGGLQPAQNLVPVLSQELFDQAGDEIAAALNPVTELLTTEELTNLGVEVAVDQTSYADAADAWLSDNGLK
jgi:osmoprotectant transport system substrate-binding protein